jgi:calmodulin
MSRVVTKTITKEVTQRVMNIDPALKDQYKEAFDMFDTDRKGFINVDQIRRALKKFGQDLTRREVEDMIKGLDTDGSGTLSFEEFITFMQTQTVEEKVDILEEDEVIAAFKSFDVDHDGVMNMAEFKTILTKLGDRFTDEECVAVFREADLDHNGTLDYHEFVEKWRKK